MTLEWKTHHDGVFTSMIDIVEGRMIITNTLIENDKRTKNEMDFLIVIEKWVDWIWDLEKYENEGMIKEGIDGDGKWWNWFYSKRYLWCGWDGE